MIPEFFMDTSPFSTPGIYSFGIDPPTILLSKTKPSPTRDGSNKILTFANCPAPPDCFFCEYNLLHKI